MFGVTISVCVAGATGWAGKAVAQGVLEAADLELVSAVSRSGAGHDLGDAWSTEPLGVPVFANLDEALEGVDVLVEYTSPSVAYDLVRAALSRGVGVVIGSSGMTAEQLDELGRQASAAGVGVIASGNFSISGAMLQMAALRAARFLDRWEVIDYADAGKVDAPSGTARELAEKLSEVGTPRLEVALEDMVGPVETRGARIGTTQVHSVRLPGYTLSTEVVFGKPGERLTIRLDAGDDASSYVEGSLLAVRSVISRVGLTRGLDTLLEEQLEAQ